MAYHLSSAGALTDPVSCAGHGPLAAILASVNR
jgi:hypothetical protein